MSAFAVPFVAANAPGTLVAQNDGGGGLSTTLVIVVIVAVLVVLALVGGARSTVVVVESPGRALGNLLGWITILVAIGIIYFAFFAHGSGSA